ncbi:MAG: class I SAM-dependent methyltransferase [Veillonellales bacterium]
MKQNIYDNELFYNAYDNLRANSAGLNDVLEIPAFRTLLPDLKDKDILDLGCGFGESCKWYASQGARRIVGVDISTKMIGRARRDFNDDKIEYVCIPMEEAHFPAEDFDLVLSSLAFHYVADFAGLINEISQWLKPGGFLIFSQEHPIATAKKIPEGWSRNDSGEKLHWILDNYAEEGLREHNWLVNGVIKYHRTLARIINSLVDNGLGIERILEPTASVEAEAANNDLLNERRRPPFILIKARKK